jgi:site-specific recombinase XerD
MSQPRTSLEQIFKTHIQTLALTLRPSTVYQYRYTARRFLAHLHAAFPQVHQLSELRRDPHLLSWSRSLCEQQPPLGNLTRIHHLLHLRRLLDDLAAYGHSLSPLLIRPEDFPPPPRYLPRPLSLPEDQLLQQELRRTDDLAANAVLLIRATGIRIGECAQLSLDCLREVGPDQWALRIPLGKLHTERLVPADPEVRRIVARILALRALATSSRLTKSQGLLLPGRHGGRPALLATLRSALAQAAQRAGCSSHVVPHQLRHSYATEMLRLGVSLPALMQFLGHKDIRMTLRYVQVTQQDLQREFHQARQNAAQPHRLPTLSLPTGILSADLPSIRQALAATRHLLEMYRRQLGHEKTKRTLERLDRRLLAVASQLARIATVEK